MQGPDSGYSPVRPRTTGPTQQRSLENLRCLYRRLAQQLKAGLTRHVQGWSARNPKSFMAVERPANVKATNISVKWKRHRLLLGTTLRSSVSAMRHQQTFGRDRLNSRLEPDSCRWDVNVGSGGYNVLRFRHISDHSCTGGLRSGNGPLRLHVAQPPLPAKPALPRRAVRADDDGPWHAQPGRRGRPPINFHAGAAPRRP